jgi:hypothetical protein
MFIDLKRSTPPREHANAADFFRLPVAIPTIDPIRSRRTVSGCDSNDRSNPIASNRRRAILVPPATFDYDSLNPHPIARRHRPAPRDTNINP